MHSTGEKLPWTLSHLKVHSDAPGQDSVGGVKVKQDSYWVVPENRGEKEEDQQRETEEENSVRQVLHLKHHNNNNNNDNNKYCCSVLVSPLTPKPGGFSALL